MSLERGREGEEAAARFLEENGYTVLERNVRRRSGEIDLVAHDPAAGQIVFVEVKARNSERFAAAEESVSPAKLRKMMTVIQAWLQKNNRQDEPARVDVITLVNDRRGARIEQLHNVTDV